MEALVFGTVVFDDNTGCLYLERNSKFRYPVVWPARASWRTDPPAVKLRGHLIEPGMDVEGAGGYVSHEFVKRLAGVAVADAAQACAEHADPTDLKIGIALFNIGSEVDVAP